jgi:hypothetical protein
MPFTAARAEQYIGQFVGSGQCVDFVRAAADAPPTSQWVEGRRVWSAGWLASGTAIATFDDDGRYANATDGTSHAAIFLERADEAGGIAVYDQWKLHPVQRRVIRARGGKGTPADDADAYSIVEIAE